MAKVKTRKKSKPNKHSDSKFFHLLEKKGMSQTELIKKLAEKSVYRDKMTIQRWCSGETSCRDLFVCKVLAEILEVDVKEIVKAFKK